MRVSLLQMEVALGEPARNRDKARRMITEAMREKPDVVVLPEMWNTGFFPANVADVADREGEETRKLLSALAGRHQVQVVGGSVANWENGELVNTNYVFDRRGQLISHYNKIHLFSPAGEHTHFRHGKAAGVFTLDGVKAAVMICYDIRFGELARMLALQGIQLLFIPAEWPLARLAHWEILVKARAIENQLFVAAVNGVGEAGDSKFCGHSMLVDPWGEVLGRAAREETILTRDIDFGVMSDIRARMNVFSDRRPELYRL